MFYNSGNLPVPTALAARASATEPRHLLSPQVTQAAREESWPRKEYKLQNLKSFERTS